ncbi:thiamine-phosphate kinase [Candidatus Omnitrophota bacterium]
MNQEDLLASIGENGFISRIQRLFKNDASVIKGIGDDAAVLSFTKDKYLLLTTDMLIEEIHFKKHAAPRRIGHKALACNISDIAAMGGVPRYAVVSVGLPGRMNMRFAKEICRGMSDISKKYNINIVGGDTNRAQSIVINVALLGFVEKKNLIVRSGAKEGDIIFVTGVLGGSLSSQRHLTFSPRIKEARYLVNHFHLNAMIDISDGLALDLHRIAESSKVGAKLFASAIPKKKNVSLTQALYDGEDFELLFTLSPREAQKLDRKKRLTTPLHMIGIIAKKSSGITLIQEDGTKRKIKPRGYTHF